MSKFQGLPHFSTVDSGTLWLARMAPWQVHITVRLTHHPVDEGGRLLTHEEVLARQARRGYTRRDDLTQPLYLTIDEAHRHIQESLIRPLAKRQKARICAIGCVVPHPWPHVHLLAASPNKDLRAITTTTPDGQAILDIWRSTRRDPLKIPASDLSITAVTDPGACRYVLENFLQTPWMPAAHLLIFSEALLASHAWRPFPHPDDLPGFF